ncbi:PH (Pleckstrin Homology) domain-containing protein [Motilibacter peucedani]|uniref:PH (Pleckstrin Homology) domain-containing protein n=1 Tax=Motilibacter peucedani TaxID=598650 RepID=A0A420XSF3_9ACTN|nr:PH domain-containing protein [Motilibacter peucedani]RKS77806.1 PH (Pleckstrin Homology) domain-containing protein [Motilibacter peucedani]
MPQLPHVFRPRWARWVPLGFAGALLVGGLLLALASSGWPAADRILMVATTLATTWFLHRLSAVRVRADDEGLTVVNLRGRRRLAWAQVVGVRLGDDDPWLVLDVSDGTTVSAMGVQGSEGAYAREQALQIARLVARRSRVTGDGRPGR